MLSLLGFTNSFNSFKFLGMKIINSKFTDLETSYFVNASKKAKIIGKNKAY